MCLYSYKLEKINNADEFGLFYQALQFKSMYLKNERCSGGKHSKLRITCLAASNAVRDKLPMLVIGKSTKSRCFKHIKNLPCKYKHRKKGWMDGEIFTNRVWELDRKFAVEGKKTTLIIIDKCQVTLKLLA